MGRSRREPGLGGDATGRYRTGRISAALPTTPDGTFAAVGRWGVHVASPTPLDRSPGRRRCGVSATRPGGRPRLVRLVRGPRGPDASPRCRPPRDTGPAFVGDEEESMSSTRGPREPSIEAVRTPDLRG